MVVVVVVMVVVEQQHAHPHSQWILINHMIMRTREIPMISLQPPLFTSARPPDIQFQQPLLRGRMTRALEFFKQFFYLRSGE